MPSGYCSDSTRNYLAGGTPDPEFVEAYAVLEAAQQAQREHARPGVTAESVDLVGRQIIADAGYGDLFIHRTGHGIGQETHEEPYIVEGNELVLEGDDLLARMIQHEIDHLDGVLLLDRVEPDVRREALRDMRTRELGATASIPRNGHDRGL